MDLPAIGRVEDPTTLDLDVINVPVVGYTMDREEVEEVFRFRPMQPAGASLDILKATSGDGSVPIAPVMRYLDSCLMEDDLASWHEFLHRPDVMIEQTVLVKIYQAISEVYAARPTPRWSGSGGGGPKTPRTSPGARRSRASTSSVKA